MNSDEGSAEPQGPPPERAAKTAGGSGARAKNNLLALGSAAVFTVYAAGYMRTRTAAQLFASETADRRPPATTDIDPAHEISRTPVTRAAPAPLDVAAPAPVAAPAQTAPAESAAKPKSPHSSPVAKPSVATPAPSAADTPAPSVVADSPKTPSPTAPAPVAPATVVDSSSAKSSETADSASKEQHVGWKDGVYFGWGTSRHGDIQAGVEIKGGKITSAFISECLTRYSCSWIAALPPQVVTRQSAEVDYVSGATQSANAFYYAVVEALKKAK